MDDQPVVSVSNARVEGWVWGIALAALFWMGFAGVPEWIAEGVNALGLPRKWSSLIGLGVWGAGLVWTFQRGVFGRGKTFLDAARETVRKRKQ